MSDFDRLLSHGLPIVTGVVLLGFSGWLYRRDGLEREHWVEQRATIVDTIRERDGDRRWAPVVEFETRGQRLKALGAYGTSEPTTGDELTIRYDPDDAANTVRVLSAFDALVVPATLLLGVGALLSGLVGALRKRPRE